MGLRRWGADPGHEGLGMGASPCGFVLGYLWHMEPFLGVSFLHTGLDGIGEGVAAF